MTALRNAVYLLRRLGWELLRFGILFVLLYLAVDQILLHRVQVKEREIAALLDTLRPEFAPQWAGEHAVLKLFPTVSEHEIEGVYNQGFAARLNRVHAAAYASRYFWNDGRLPRHVKEALAEAQRSLTRLRVVQREMRPRVLNIELVDSETLQNTANTAYLYASNSDVGYLAATSLVQFAGKGDDPAQAMLSVLLAGESLLLTQHRDTSSLSFQQEVIPTSYFLSAVHMALVSNAVTDADAERLKIILTRLQRAARLSPLRHGLASGQLAHPPIPATPEEIRLQRIRPYASYQRLRYLELGLDLAAAIAIPDKEARNAAYLPLITRIRGGAPEEIGLRIEQTISDTNSRENTALHCAVLILMLQLEQHRLSDGTYPESIDNWDAWSPPGLLPNTYTHARMNYVVDDDRLGYRLTLRGHGTYTREGIQGGAKQQYVRRYQEHPFE